MNFFHKFFRTRHVQTTYSTEYEKRRGHVAMATEKVLHNCIVVYFSIAGSHDCVSI